jgi:hypothetical protein
VREFRKAYCEAHRETQQSQRKAWAAANLDKLCAKAARRRAAKLRAIPRWANHNAIAAIYVEAQRLTRETGIEHHVDHIVPIASRWVCGLHCEANLQILLGCENLSKNNWHWPDMGLIADFPHRGRQRVP